LGIVHRNKLFYKLGQRFGYDLYSDRPIERILEPALVFEADALLEQVSRKVLERDENAIYDAVAVVRNGVYCGIVKMSRLYQRITEQKIALAMQANPMTGLPGNNRIEEEIGNRLAMGQIFSVLYVDLDNFKPFNDHYGFDQGDQVIRFLGNLLKDALHEWDMRAFIGHIGGEDFVVVSRSDRVEELCRRIIERFDGEVLSYHDEDAVRKGYYESCNRKGEQKRFKLLSVSIGVLNTGRRMFSSYAQLASVASEVKKKAKTVQGSNWYVDKRRR
jgi:diguanylate cyclase (GGDEF)-like protein